MMPPIAWWKAPITFLNRGVFTKAIWSVFAAAMALSLCISPLCVRASAQGGGTSAIRFYNERIHFHVDETVDSVQSGMPSAFSMDEEANILLTFPGQRLQLLNKDGELLHAYAFSWPGSYVACLKGNVMELYLVKSSLLLKFTTAGDWLETQTLTDSQMDQLYRRYTTLAAITSGGHTLHLERHLFTANLLLDGKAVFSVSSPSYMMSAYLPWIMLLLVIASAVTLLITRGIIRKASVQENHSSAQQPAD